MTLDDLLNLRKQGKRPELPVILALDWRVRYENPTIRVTSLSTVDLRAVVGLDVWVHGGSDQVDGAILLAEKAMKAGARCVSVRNIQTDKAVSVVWYWQKWIADEHGLLIHREFPEENLCA
jgi:hypothetical protein